MVGSEIMPMAITVAPITLVVAASKAPTRTTETPSPPRTVPNRRAMATRRSSATRDFSSIRPMKMNNGTAINTSVPSLL